MVSKLYSTSLQKQRSLVLDNTYLEKVIFSLFQINIRNLIINKAQLAKNFHIQPSEIDRMMMWEYEMFMQELNEIVKSENKEQQKEMDKYHLGDVQKMANPKNMNKMMNPKMPDMSQVKMPSIGSIKF